MERWEARTRLARHLAPSRQDKETDDDENDDDDDDDDDEEEENTMRLPR